MKIFCLPISYLDFLAPSELADEVTLTNIIFKGELNGFKYTETEDYIFFTSTNIPDSSGNISSYSPDDNLELFTKYFTVTPFNVLDFETFKYLDIQSYNPGEFPLIPSWI